MTCLLVDVTLSYYKYLVDNRYYVYLHDCSCQNMVYDTKENKDITNTVKGATLIIAAYNTKNPR